MRNLYARSEELDEIQFLDATERVLHAIRIELVRQRELQQAGRFELACSDPRNSDDQNFQISTEEFLETARELQIKPRDEDRLDDEIMQAAATFAGWLIARRRRRQNA